METAAIQKLTITPGDTIIVYANDVSQSMHYQMSLLFNGCNVIICSLDTRIEQLDNESLKKLGLIKIQNSKLEDLRNV